MRSMLPSGLPLWRGVASVAFACAIIVACGARSALPGGVEDVADASLDALDDKAGHPLDANPDCEEPAYCDPADQTKIFKCGVAIYQCGALEECIERDPEGAQCVNPCADSLGNDTSNGCDFYAVEMDTTDQETGVCFAVFVVNQWASGEPAKLEVSRGDEELPIAQFARIPVGKGTGITYAPYDANKGLEKDQIAILFLSRDPAGESDPDPTSPRRLAGCPAGVTPAVVGDAALHGTGRGSAFHIKSNVPVVAYQMLPYGAGRARVTGATLLLPTNVWDTNYLIADAFTAPTLFDEDRAGPITAILGQEDDTQVTIRPSVRIEAGGGLAGSPRNVPVTYTVNKGEYLQFTQRAELTGSIVSASAPVAVIGGSTLMDVPTSVARADGAHQMLPPIKALASEYVAVRYRSRDKFNEELVPWRIVGAVDGTKLTYEPSRPAGAPTALSAGQLAQFDATGPFVVRSQDADHPFYVASYMTGGASFNGEGDPEFVNVLAPAQYLPRYTFFTDPTYPETNLVIVRVKDPTLDAFPDVTLDCFGTLDGWQSIGSKYQFTRFDLSTGNFEGQNGCDNGVHTIVGSFSVGAPGAAQPRFGVTVWGWGNPITWPFDDPQSDDEANPRFTRWVSYGYPAGANYAPLNDVVVPAK
jgi:hypothetical protein